MYRARQIVVTGDSKQLQPNDLYRVRWEEDDDSYDEYYIYYDKLVYFEIDDAYSYQKCNEPEMIRVFDGTTTLIEKTRLIRGWWQWFLHWITFRSVDEIYTHTRRNFKEVSAHQITVKIKNENDETFYQPVEKDHEETNNSYISVNTGGNVK